jgi:hypothetical protein
MDTDLLIEFENIIALNFSNFYIRKPRVLW